MKSHLSWYRESRRLIINLERGQIEIFPTSPRCIRVRTTVEGVMKRPGAMVIDCSVFDDWSVTEVETGLVLSTDEIQLKISHDARLSWYDKSGNILLDEPDNARDIEKTDVCRYRYDTSSRVEVIKTVDGERTIGVPSEVYVDRQAIRYKQQFTITDNEALYGLGQHEEDCFNLKEKSQHLFQANMKSPAPVVLSTMGYGLFFDTAAVSGFSSEGNSMKFWSNCADSLTYYFILGPEFDEIIHSIRTLTGEVPMLPRWAFGYIQSKERYESSEDLLAIADEFRLRNIPIDCLVQDWKYWPNDWWGEKSFDPDRFPDPSALINGLHERNLKLMVSIWPNLRNEGPNHRSLREDSFLLGDDSSYNAFLPEARDQYWSQAEEGIFRHGVDAWWCDSTEPFNNEWAGSKKPDDKTRLKLVDESFNRYLDPADANAYPLIHAQGIYEGQRASSKSKRVINLTRSSFPGQQRYGCIVWSGDISARWDVLRQQISAGLNFCATGFPYWTVDIGGFFVGGHACYKKWIGSEDADPVWFWDGDYDDGVDDLGYRELYVRWLQWGAFLPIMRSHGTDTPREPWQFGPSDGPFYRVIVDFIKLRYQLLPYIYSLAGWQTHKNYTMMRMLAFDYRHDPQVYDIADQYMLGPSMMVCPVTKPMYYGPNSEPLKGASKSRSVYLPKGSDWFDFWTGEKHLGGQTIQADCPLDQIPAFVKAGSIIPIGSPVEHSGEIQKLTIRVYPGQDAEFELYSDDGDGYGYEQGEYTLNKLEWNEAEQALKKESEFSAEVEIVDHQKQDHYHESAPSRSMLSLNVRL